MWQRYCKMFRLVFYPSDITPSIVRLSFSSEILALDEALTRLAKLDERQSKVVELRFFAGMNDEETALALGVSTRTVKRDWRIAKAWLFKELSC